MFKRHQSARTRLHPFAAFCSSFAVILLRPYLAHDRLTHCKDECSSAMKSAKSRRFGPPKKTLSAKGLALSENFGLRRLVLEDCVRHHPVAPNWRNFLASGIGRHFRGLAPGNSVCGRQSAVSAANRRSFGPKVSGRKFSFPGMLIQAGRSWRPRPPNATPTAVALKVCLLRERLAPEVVGQFALRDPPAL